MPGTSSLPAGERRVLLDLVAGGSPVLARRARIVPLRADGAAPDAVAAEVGCTATALLVLVVGIGLALRSLAGA